VKESGPIEFKGLDACVDTKEMTMNQLRIVVACLFVVGLMALPTSPAAAAPGTKMIKKINKVRAKHGLRAVRRSRGLARSARSYARVMMARDYFGHGARIRAPRKFRRKGEAIAMSRGHRARPRRALRMWMHSPGHRALVLSSGFRFAGAGVTRGRYHGRRTTMWVLHLGAR
jgi:uncharacterized protein YkwD